MLTAASMLCMIGGEAFFFFKRNMSIGDLDSSYHIANNDTGLYDFTTTNKSMQRKLHLLGTMKYCAKAGANNFSPVCKDLQGSKILSEFKNKIVIQSTSGNIMLDC